MIFSSIKCTLTELTVKSILAIQALPNRIRSWFHSDKILRNTPYKGEQILLIALYQKGILRNDIKNLLALAKEKNLYVIGVNTQKLEANEKISSWFDCYIERFNFGRDFGSYKTGFKYIYHNNYHHQCPRLIMLNDSVFYESSRAGKFLNDLMNTHMEVLGATENYEIQPHLGSFCISIAGRILQQRKFMQFWRHYRNSDVRPSVIKNGEMALSICLKKLALSPAHFGALYDAARIVKSLQENNQLPNIALKLARRSPHFGVSRLEVVDLWKRFFSIFFIGDMKIIDRKLTFYPLFDLSHMEEVVKICSPSKQNDILPKMSQFVSAEILRVFREGSQIHRNGALLLYLGLPLIKLDCFYRGAVAEEDILILSSLVQKHDIEDLQALLLKKPFGGDTLFGWKRYLFSYGYI